MGRQDYVDALAPRPQPERQAAAPIPSLVPLTEPVETTQPAAVRVLTVRTDGSTPVRDLLLGMARTAGVDVDIDPAVDGAVMISATERPFLEIVERVADRGGLRWRFRDGYLLVEPDMPVVRTYRIDYLNIVRRTESSVATNASVSGPSGEGGSSTVGAGNGSTSSVIGRSEADFWGGLERDLASLLGLDPAGLAGPESLDGAPIPTAFPAAPAQLATQAAPQPPDGDGSAPLRPDGSADASGQSDLADLARLLTERLARAPDGPEAITRADAPPRPEIVPAVLARPAAPRAAFTVNRQAGLLSVRATGRQHRLVADYLRELARTITAQVLIEARVVEVTLADDFESGINWRSLFGGNFEGGFNFGRIVSEPPFTAAAGLNPITAGTATFALANADLTAVVNLVQRFGTVRTLSSPRVTVVQNQTAVLKVAENQVFFRLQFQTQQSQQGGLSTTSVSSELNTVPVGVIITVQPAINLDTDRIALAVRPTVTRVVDFVADPAVAIASENSVESLIPVVSVQELDSVVTMASGQVLVMGGLMQNSVSATDSGVPGLSRVPLLGNLFKGRTDATAKRELVVFLKASIVEGSTLDAYDHEIYDSFGRDRRPL